MHHRRWPPCLDSFYIRYSDRDQCLLMCLHFLYSPWKGMFHGSSSLKTETFLPSDLLITTKAAVCTDKAETFHPEACSPRGPPMNSEQWDHLIMRDNFRNPWGLKLAEKNIQNSCCNVNSKLIDRSWFVVYQLMEQWGCFRAATSYTKNRPIFFLVSTFKSVNLGENNIHRHIYCSHQKCK